MQFGTVLNDWQLLLRRGQGMKCQGKKCQGFCRSVLWQNYMGKLVFALWKCCKLLIFMKNKAQLNQKKPKKSTNKQIKPKNSKIFIDQS